MKKSLRFSPEVRELTVRLVQEHRGELMMTRPGRYLEDKFV